MDNSLVERIGFTIIETFYYLDKAMRNRAMYCGRGSKLRTGELWRGFRENKEISELTEYEVGWNNTKASSVAEFSPAV